jgi:hypothetical protein
MRRLIRIALAVAVLAALSAAFAATVAAGNYAETSIVDGADTPPTAGEPHELRLLLLQHGVTPVNSGDVRLTASLPGSGETLNVPATSVGNGEWVATVTFPAAGDWQLRILHSVFETPPPAAFVVAPTSGMTWMPATGAIVGMLLVAVALILLARRISGGRAADEPIREPVRAG